MILIKKLKINKEDKKINSTVKIHKPRFKGFANEYKIFDEARPHTRDFSHELGRLYIC